MIVGGLVFGVMGMIATARYAITNNFGEAMRFGAVWATFRNGLGRWLGLIVMLVLVSIVFGLGAMITCGLGFLFSFFVVLVQSHWVAQAHRESSGALEPSLG
jgi:hypothetical protein